MAKRERPRFVREVGDARNPQGLLVMMLRYIDHLKIKGCTDYSLYNAERNIREFIAWCDVRSLERPIQISRAILESYQRTLWYYRKKDGEPLKIHSQRARLIPLRSFFKWLARNDHIPANPAADMDMPRAPRQLPRDILSIAEVERIMALPDTTTALGLRDRAMLEVFYSTGMRRMELGALQLHHLDLAGGTVFIYQGKGRRDRYIPIGRRAAKWVSHYLEEGRPQLAWNAEERTVFLSRDGEPLALCWLSTTTAKYIKRAKLGKSGGCHLLRHTMATHMLEGGADVRYIQAMLGHERLSTTEIYTHVAIRQLMMIHEATHPANTARDGETRRAEVSQVAVAELFEVLAEEAREERCADLVNGDGRGEDAPDAV